MHTTEHSTILGTASGTVFSVIAMVDPQDYIKTIVLACVGAIVSFMVSLALKWIRKRIKG
jgi:mannitol-specific phosphotransferase system IIBC component